jgi:hypothetical protein
MVPSAQCRLLGDVATGQEAAVKEGQDDMTKEHDEHFRWLATATYRSERGPIEVDHAFEELEELHDLIERGPDWNTIETIIVRLNPRGASYPDDTIEAATER